jgi:hypothetical protein
MTQQSEEARTSTAEAIREEEPSTELEADQPLSTDEIRLRAYYRYMERQGGDGDEIADWLAAESELRQRGETTAPC